MLKKKITICLLVLSLLVVAVTVYAQATATPIQMGYLTSSGCPGSAFTCFIPYSSSNPLPVQLAIVP